jgi:undecaprenyl-diphosphatase
MDYPTVIVLAVLQGVAEFLPISSSAHLVIAEAIFAQFQGQTPTDLTSLNIALHGGTLVSIVAVYRQRIGRLLGQDRRVLGLLFVGSLPAALIGLPVRMWWAHGVLENPLLAGCLLPLTGLMLIWAGRQPAGDTDYRELSYGRAALIGLAQAAALLPGISRSGATISAGLAVGLERGAAATFSFLLALPVIGGACLLELAAALAGGPAADSARTWPLLLTGAIVAAATGVIALRWLLAWLNQGRLPWFAAWCIPVGLAVVAWQLLT